MLLSPKSVIRKWHEQKPKGSRKKVIFLVARQLKPPPPLELSGHIF